MSAKYAEWVSPEGLEKIRGWAAAGLTVTEIAANIGVKPKTLYDWRLKFQDFADAMDAGTGDAVELVQNALFKKCLGYTVDLQKTFKIREVKYDRQGKKVSETEKLVPGIEQVHVPADVQAQKFFLTNRAPDDWKNRMELTPPAAQGALEKYLKELEEAENGHPGPQNIHGDLSADQDQGGQGTASAAQSGPAEAG